MKKAALGIFLLTLPLLASAQWDKDVLQFRGRLALSEGKYSQAIENLNIVARLDTTDYWTFFYRGIAKYNLGDLRGARQDFDRSVRINSLFTNGYHYRAITKSRSGQYDDALEDLQKAIDLRPGLTGLYFSRGVTYFLAQRFDEALEDFDKYIRKEPKDPSAYLNRGACLMFLKDTSRALEDYNRAIRLDRFESEGYIRRGRLYASSGDLAKGITDMDQAISLDKANSFAYFNRALMYSEQENYPKALADLDKVLELDPGNSLTLYNRSLVKMRLSDFDSALEDMDRVLNINPRNVLAYFNRAACFCELGRWSDAVQDYSSAIGLYPDFAKAYQNRAYAENELGMKKESKRDYETARRKIEEYRKSTGEGGSFADTTKKYESLLAFDAEFASHDFDDELLQHRDIDIRLKPLWRWRIASGEQNTIYALRSYYENPVQDEFRKGCNVEMAAEGSAAGYDGPADSPKGMFLKGIAQTGQRQFGAALAWYDAAVQASPDGPEKAMYLLNRAVLKAEMTDFIASMSSSVQTLTLDDKGATRARVSDRAEARADYTDALDDITAAAELLPDNPYVQFNLGNLSCLSSSPVDAVESYDRAIRLYPAMAEAYYNRGLVLILLKDREKGCISLSRAGELGVQDAYGVIGKYCKSEND